ncbi:phosphotransferase enzyme family protein [Nocardiopsis xinjiangensis]|uniref:phosphotransferase enzyme family protein n=1 Tax=Nocardiopsis xinjiangensis TaxID=124285 RepID=UPI000344E87A|nr:aminoglycoside phosphotransferase family protein [Nocardiopsis xinjiangensis]
MDPAEVGQVVGELYSLEGLELTPIDGGADLEASSWKAVDARGRRFAVKWSTGGSPAGAVLPAALDAALPGSAPAPVPARDGSLWTDIDGARLSVMEWIDGTSGFDAPLGERGWRAFGQLLAALHTLPVEGEVRSVVPREGFDPTRWAEYFEQVDAEIDAAPSGEITKRLAELWHPHRAELRGVHQHTHSLAERLRSRSDLPRYVPCHGDPHLGNLVLTGVGRPALLDFDDAVLAPPERDLMFVLGGGVLADPAASGEQQRWFMEGYGPHTADADLLTYYRGLRLLEDTSELASILLAPSSTGKDRDEALGHLTGVFSPTGLLVQARSEAHRS